MRHYNLKYIGSFLIIGLLALVLCGCGSTGSIDEDNGGDGGENGAPPENLSVSTTQISVKSDNSDSALITATVLNSNNAPYAGVDVSFQVDSGMLMPAEELEEGAQFDPTSVTTGTDGIAQVLFSSGTADKSNRTVNVTVVAQGLSAKLIPIQVTGTTVAVDNNKTNLLIDEDEKALLTVTIQDASLNSIFDAPVDVSVIPAGALSWKAVDGNLRTDVTGQVRLEVWGNQEAEAAVLRIDTMGTTATQSYTVSSPETLFAIVSPDSDPFAQPTGQELPVVVQAPTQSRVRFSTTFGTWKNGDKVIDVHTANGMAIAHLTSAEAGLATIQVFDVNNPNISDTMQIVVLASSSEAFQLSLQPSAGVIQPSTGDTKNTLTLRATVKNATDQVVSGVPVAFSLERTTGGGESISPVIVFTNDQGLATATFFSGALASGGNGVLVKAQVVGEPAVSDFRSIIIGGTAGSVVIGRSTQVQSSENNTSYTLPMSVVVSDSNGNPVSGAQVTLGAWPVQYSTGYWTSQPCVPIITGTYDNEDINRNLIYDSGEDGNEDNQLTPPNSAAGNTIPSVVRTNENGVADFDLVYLKASAVWIRNEITATTLVGGTETQSKLAFQLPFQEGEECNLPNSPYSGVDTGGNLFLSTDATQLLANGKSSAEITATVLNSNGSLAEAGTVVEFRVVTGGGGFPSSQVIITSTGAEGTATVTYTAPKGTAQGGTVTIEASSPAVETPGQVSISLGKGELVLSTNGPTTLSADGQSSVEVTAQVFGLDGHYIESSERVDFTLAGPGGLPYSKSAITFTSGGTATAKYIAGTVSGLATITAVMESGASDEIQLTLEDNTQAAALTSFQVIDHRYSSQMPDHDGTAFLLMSAVSDESRSGLSDTSISTPIPITSLAVVQETGLSQILYAATGGSGVYMSKDSGATWVHSSLSSANSPSFSEPFIKGHSAISVDPDDPKVVCVGTGYAGQGTLFCSAKGGLNLNSGSTQEWNPLFRTNAAVLTVLADGNESPYIWAGTEGHGVWYSRNGKDFLPAATGLTSGTVVWDIIKVGGSGSNAFLYAAEQNGIYWSKDGGDQWARTDPWNSIQDTIRVLKVHPDSSGGRSDVLYVGTAHSGVWSSIDGGESWACFNSGIAPGQAVLDLLIDPVNDFLYAVTYDEDGDLQHASGNIWVHKLDSTGWMPADSTWLEADRGLEPGFTDGRFALAADDPENPQGLFVASSALGCYTASDGLKSGSPLWRKCGTDPASP